MSRLFELTAVAPPLSPRPTAAMLDQLSAQRGRAAASCAHHPRPPCSPILRHLGQLRSRNVSRASRPVQRRRHAAMAVRADASWSPPTVAKTKQAFYETFKQPIPPIYNTVIQELLVQQHLMRWNKNYQYDPVFALGFISVFDQILEGLPENVTKQVLQAYLQALDEDANQYRSDAEKMESWAKGLSGGDELKPDAGGAEVQQQLAAVADRVKEGKFSYNKFFAIGLFRLLELTGAKDPKALESLCGAMNVRAQAVNRDLTGYKAILTKLSAAKEMMAELTAREKRKQAERDAEKAEASQKKETVEAKA